MKCLKVVLMLLLVLALAGGLQAVMALDQDFEGFTLGSLGTAGQGVPGDVGGKWFAVNVSADPSIVQDPGDPNNNQCVRITGGQAMLAGYSLAAPVAEDTPFIVAFSVFPMIWTATDVGSFYVYLDKFESLDPTKPGISMHNYTVGPLVVWDGKMGAYRSVTMGEANLFTQRETWVDIKIHVKTWDAGDGYGRWDLWYNMNNGDGWFHADWNIPFDSSRLHDGANAVLFRPRMPSSGALACFDNVYITTEPLDCQEALIFAGGPQAVDYDSDCVVDVPDLGAWAPVWLGQLANAPVDWDYQWDCDELPNDSGLWELIADPGTGSVEPTQSVSGGIYTVSSAPDAYSFHWTVDGIYDANYPAMVEFRVRMQSATQAVAAIISFYDELYAFGGLSFRPERYYEDAEGWATYRTVTVLDEANHLAEIRLYVKHADDTWWFAASALPYLEQPEAAFRDLFYFGDASSGHGGTWQEDYFYWTQDEAAIDSFLADVALTPYDLTADGVINLEDFALLASDWLVDIAP